MLVDDDAAMFFLGDLWQNAELAADVVDRVEPPFATDCEHNVEGKGWGADAGGVEP